MTVKKNNLARKCQVISNSYSKVLTFLLKITHLLEGTKISQLTLQAFLLLESCRCKMISIFSHHCKILMNT